MLHALGVMLVKRLEKAIKQWDGIPIEIEWHPFQLDPNIPKEGLIEIRI